MALILASQSPRRKVLLGFITTNFTVDEPRDEEKVDPGTPADAIRCLTDELDGVLVMAVNPGFAGQKYIPSTTGKIREVRRILDEAGREDAEIEVDGNVSLPNARIMRKAGADIFVAGTSSVFLKDGRIAQHLAELREACR